MIDFCYVQEQLGSPALAFTRAVCEVLGLDSQVTDEVAILRRNLLRLSHTPEFSEDASFVVGALPGLHGLFLGLNRGRLPET